MIKKMFEPIEIGSMQVKNRFVVPAMVSNYVLEDGLATEKFIAYHEEKAKGGWGLIIVEDYPVLKNAGGFKTLPGLWHDGQIDSHKILTTKVKAHGAKIVAQIYHAGRATSSAITGERCVAPSPYADPVVGETPIELSQEGIDEIVEAFGDTALRAKKAGFDGIELHGAHGYLLGQFMSPFSNKRTDRYGGSILNRARFALEVIENIKKKVGDDFTIIYRMSVDEFVEGGLKVADNRVVAMLLEKAGVHGIHCSNSVYKSAAEFGIPPAAGGHAWSSNLTQEIKSVVGIPVITVGRINDPLIAESVLASNKADLVAMGRASLADPHLPNKTMKGAFDDIIRCIGCMQGCIGRNSIGLPVQCLVNPMTGRESEWHLDQADHKKKIAVVGGGIAGMQAAITASKRGHEVHLYEKNQRLGGQWLIAAVPPTKEELSSFTVWQKHQLDHLDVQIHLNTVFSKEDISKNFFDEVIVATGARPFAPNITGLDLGHVVYANDVLSGRTDLGHRVAVIGGGLVGAETAAHLSGHGKEVTLIEMQAEIAKDCEYGVRLFLMKDLKKNDVIMLTHTSVEEILPDGLMIKNNKGKIKKLANIDSVVLAIGSKSVNDFRDSTYKVIGDAKEVRRALEAIEEGHHIGLTI
ncbi:FAD-dependent oxidoreductase [Acidaminobacter sp. JC074]|uniref:FAD-dependent oxidoreductase n=1 Tax=Acidaminobacter sp. JC074 TaxID=2530199 RepID=UPI001F10F4A8|nr:FAD-dependent oxidoreductase [Acidaminobacter sp. JC074]MCH4889239.1 FAD-dependent oxidoreductase [Acidaminobacter sp. JC074]